MKSTIEAVYISNGTWAYHVEEYQWYSYTTTPPKSPLTPTSY